MIFNPKFLLVIALLILAPWASHARNEIADPSDIALEVEAVKPEIAETKLNEARAANPNLQPETIVIEGNPDHYAGSDDSWLDYGFIIVRTLVGGALQAYLGLKYYHYSEPQAIAIATTVALLLCVSQKFDPLLTTYVAKKGIPPSPVQSAGWFERQLKELSLDFTFLTGVHFAEWITRFSAFQPGHVLWTSLLSLATGGQAFVLKTHFIDWLEENYPAHSRLRWVLSKVLSTVISIGATTLDVAVLDKKISNETVGYFVAAPLIAAAYIVGAVAQAKKRKKSDCEGSLHSCSKSTRECNKPYAPF